MRSYIFTDKFHSGKSVMSSVLGAISAISPGVAVYLSYRIRGEVRFSYGLAVLLALVFAITGIILGVLARQEGERFYFFANLGIFFGCVSIAEISMILYAGL